MMSVRKSLCSAGAQLHEMTWDREAPDSVRETFDFRTGAIS
jgi:hypothetical protein